MIHVPALRSFLRDRNALVAQLQSCWGGLHGRLRDGLHGGLHGRLRDGLHGRLHGRLHGGPRESRVPLFSFWEPRERLPPYLRLCMETWARHFTGFEVILMDYSNMDRYIGRETYNRSNLLKLTLPQQADAVRVAALERHGGAWMDCDTIAVASAAPLLELGGQHDLISFGKAGRRTAVGLMYARRPHARVFSEWRATCEARIKDLPRVRPWSYLSNDVVTPWIQQSRFSDKEWHIADRTEYGIFAETMALKKYGKEIYNQYWFDTSAEGGKTLMGGKQFAMCLHNSWTPGWYREKSREWIIGDSRERLSRVLRLALLK